MLISLIKIMKKKKTKRHAYFNCPYLYTTLWIITKFFFFNRTLCFLFYSLNPFFVFYFWAVHCFKIEPSEFILLDYRGVKKKNLIIKERVNLGSGGIFYIVLVQNFILFIILIFLFSK
jgi:hypothetical protein